VLVLGIKDFFNDGNCLIRKNKGPCRKKFVIKLNREPIKWPALEQANVLWVCQKKDYTSLCLGIIT